MKLTIKRSEWLRGEGPDDSLLLRQSDGKKCCLGFLALALDATEKYISGRASPANAPALSWPEGFVLKDLDSRYENSGCIDLIETNDTTFLSETEREDALTKHFKKFDIDVEFVD